MLIKVDSKLNLFDQKVHDKHNSICKFGFNYTYLPQSMLMINDKLIYLKVCLSLSTLFKEELMNVYMKGKK